jgi:ubiquinone biosynthesis protein
MGISLRPEHLKRYREMAQLLFRYGRSDLVRSAGLEGALDDVQHEGEADHAEARDLAADLERMGPTYVKLGQLLSTRPDLIPAPYVDALSRLQDRVEPFDGEEAERIVAGELGVRVSKAFSAFDRVPMAAASLAQVHHAVLRDGREVAVKVQRPGVRERIVEDLDAIEDVVGFMDRHTKTGRRYEPARVLEELRRTLINELDYRREARNMATLATNLEEFELLLVPRPVEDLSSGRVLTMEYVRGSKITSLSPLARMEVDGEALAEELFRAYLKQILVDGFFHADPHPGNVFLTPERRICLLDLGMVGTLGPQLQQDLLRLLLAISEGRGDEAARVAIGIGEKRDGFDAPTLTRDVGALVADFAGSTSARDLQVGRVMLEVTRTAAENGLRLPVELSVLGRALLALDQVGRTLDPEFDPNASIRSNAAQLMERRMVKNLSPGRMFASMLEVNDLVQKLPERANQALDAIAERGLEVRVRVPEEVWMLQGMQKISNRITTGLVAAALIIAAAMMMQVPTQFRILGYPGLGMLLFIGAAALGVLLVADIVLSDVRERRGAGDR